MAQTRAWGQVQTLSLPSVNVNPHERGTNSQGRAPCWTPSSSGETRPGWGSHSCAQLGPCRSGGRQSWPRAACCLLALCPRRSTQVAGRDLARPPRVQPFRGLQEDTHMGRMLGVLKGPPVLYDTTAPQGWITPLSRWAHWAQRPGRSHGHSTFEEWVPGFDPSRPEPKPALSTTSQIKRADATRMGSPGGPCCPGSGPSSSQLVQ